MHELHHDAAPLEGRSPGGLQRYRQPLQVVQVAIAQTSVESRTKLGRRRLRVRTFRHFEFRQDSSLRTIVNIPIAYRWKRVCAVLFEAKSERL